MTVSPDGKLAASCDSKGDLILWDPDNLKEKQVLHLAPPYSGKGAEGTQEVFYIPDGRHLLCRNSNGTVYVVRLSSPIAKVSSPVPSSSTGFTPLFNGKDLKNWTRDKEGFGNWKVADATLSCVGPQDYLYTTRDDFDDFHLRVEVKISDKGNSGIYFRAGKPVMVTGDYEAQINSTHSDSIRTGSLYRLIDVKGMLVPPDSWFTYDIITKGSRIRLLVNGKESADYTETRPNRPTKGHIVLQQMAGTVHFRKIEIKAN